MEGSREPRLAATRRLQQRPSSRYNNRTPASLIVLNGSVLGHGRSTAIAIADDRILSVGTDREVLDTAGPRTRTLDAAGGLITPGFNDAHQHLRMGAHQLPNLDLSAETTVDGIRGRIAAFAQAHPNRPWITGRGWFYHVFPGGFPSRALLDSLIPDRPAAFESYDAHTTWVNSAALARLQITTETPDPAGGQIVREAGGDATGILKERAMELVDRALPAVSVAEDLDLLQQAMRLANQYGVTSIQDAGVPVEQFAIYDTLRAAGMMSVRLRLAQHLEPGRSLHDVERALADWEEVAFPRRRDPWLRGGILKAFLDGVVESRTAALLAPYEGAAPDDPAACGHPRWEVGEFREVVRMADRRGWQVQAHAIGDGAVRQALDGFEAAAIANGPRDRRHRIEHIETIDPSDIPRFGRLGVIASMQPYHADPAPNLLEIWVQQIGAARASRGWAWGSIRRAGGRLAFGSDWPVVSLDPRLGLNMAVNRNTPSGEPAGGWLPQERLLVADALAGYTAGGAYAEFAESDKGTLGSGLLADLTIWDRDLRSEPTGLLLALVRATVVGGQVVYEQGVP
ncbi:MAG TPA: amidohydrolase [Candidatus Limnocylindria bacterium]|nr:amidohydrolase [Candidatus Limnocylindria bacterium]